MTNSVLVNFYGGYVRLSSDYIVKDMTMKDLDRFITLALDQDEEIYKDRFLLDLDTVVDALLHNAFDLKTINKRRFQMIVKRLQRCGICTRWNQHYIDELFKDW